MLDAGGGGGTAWSSMSMDDMRRLIQSANTDSQWDIVTGWQRSSELLLEHRYQVENYKTNLAAAWPPEQSTASQAYLDRLQLLIDNLTETYEASLANHDALVAATGSIYQAQVKMEKLYAEYQSNQTLLNEFNAAKQQTQSSGTPTPTPSPSGEQSPVAPGRQEDLRNQAITMLSSVSTDLAQAQVRIVTPTKYEPAPIRDESKTANDGGYTAPPIPPLTPSFADDGGSTGSSRPSTTFPTSTGTTVNPPITTPVTQQPGLVLGGTNPPLVTPPTTGINPITPTLPTGTGPISNPGLLPPSTGLLPGGTSLLPPGAGAGRGGLAPREGLLRPAAGRIPEGMRAMAPNGVIGRTPVGLGQPGTGRTGGARVNPVGGVIGESQSALGSRRGAGPSGMSTTEHAGTYGQGGSRRSGRRDESDGTHWDPDNPWETAEGVDPVVLPVREQRIDPGPAIGLS